MTRRAALLGVAVAVAALVAPLPRRAPRTVLHASLVRLPVQAGPPISVPFPEPTTSTTSTTILERTTPTTARASRSAPRRTPPPTTTATVPSAPAPAPPAAGQTATASWYSLGRGAGACRNYANVRQTCADAYPYTFAHLTMAFGTRVQFCHDGRCVVATCTDRGPYVAGRTFDLSAETAAALDPAYRSRGVLAVGWSVLT